MPDTFAARGRAARTAADLPSCGASVLAL